MEDNVETVYLDGYTLSTELLLRLGRRVTPMRIQLHEDAVARILESRQVVDNIVTSGRLVYGVSTGFGKFAQVRIKAEDRQQLQDNLIRSHAAGVGKPLSLDRTRMLLVVRINILAKGYSGISLDTIQGMVNAWNHNCLSYVPEKGTVGASGDLAPLSHLALGLLGEGLMWDDETKTYREASEVLEKCGLPRLHLKEKEGLALINGTQFISSLGAECVERAKLLIKTADTVAAMTLEALKGTMRAFLEEVHQARPHKGQLEVAARLRQLLHSEKYPSTIWESHAFCDAIQDSYTLRCIPQVHGVVIDTIEFVERILNTELNSATDNPMVLVRQGNLVSCGNFHGEYPAKMCDYLSIAVHELANISERRIERLMNPDLSKLPAFLVENGGLNSGFMIAHCTAAALTSENKTLCHPASSDTLPTSSGKEDHVSMGGWAARKSLEVIEHVETVVGIELMCACQALDLIEKFEQKETTAPLNAVRKLVRSKVNYYDKDRYLAPDIDACTELVRSGAVWTLVESFL